MSSIAYVTDKHMIEFHRLNGNSRINFWRPSIGKRFTDFHSGDLLFFLAKGTERPNSKEKGLIGYGRFSDAHPLSFKQMWNNYGYLNGYPTETTLKEAILRVAKSKTLPPRLSCLNLSDVVFFQAPVYLSELGMNISNSVESYIYLDREDPEVTTRILFRANAIGVDAWTSAVSPYAPTSTVFEDDLYRYTIQLHASRLPDIGSEKEQQRASRLLAQYLHTHPDYQWLDARHKELFRLTKEGMTLVQCLVSTRQELKQKIIYMIGKSRILEQESRSIPDIGRRDIQCILLCEGHILPEWHQLVEAYPIRLESLEIENKD